MLTREDKMAIKKAILKAVENGCQEPELMLTKIINTLERIDRFGACSVKGADYGSSPTIGEIC